MKEYTVKTFTIDELSLEAQEKAHQDYLSSGFEYGWLEEYESTLNAFADVFPVVIKGFEFSSWRADVDWSFDNENLYYDAPDADLIVMLSDLSGLRLQKYVWNNYRNSIYKGKYYSTSGKWIDGKYTYTKRYSRIQIEADNCTFTGFCADNDILQPVINFLNGKAKDFLPGGKFHNYTFSDLMSDCISDFEGSVRAECKAQESFEYFLDHAAANNYEYLADGKSAHCFI